MCVSIFSNVAALRKNPKILSKKYCDQLATKSLPTSLHLMCSKLIVGSIDKYEQNVAYAERSYTSYCTKIRHFLKSRISHVLKYLSICFLNYVGNSILFNLVSFCNISLYYELTTMIRIKRGEVNWSVYDTFR